MIGSQCADMISRKAILGREKDVSVTGHVSALSMLGPQLPGESGLAARTRFHQSWFRVSVLGCETYGKTVHHGGCRALGSILAPDDAEAGLNFVSPGALKLYASRRRQGWGVDPVRCTSYLTASQALSLNLLGPLWADHSWATRVFSAVLNVEVQEIEIFVEFAPPRRSCFLGDQTRVDGWLRLVTADGPSAVVLEIKYADRFNSRHIDLSGRDAYHKLGSATGLWDLSDPKTNARQVNQLLRCHALGVATWLELEAGDRLPRLILLHHPDDPAAANVADAYRSVLRRPDLFSAATINHLIAQMGAAARTGQQRTVVEYLTKRYVLHGLSETLWTEHLAERATR